MKPFYVRHKDREEAIEVIDRAVANGAELYEGVAGCHSEDECWACYSGPEAWWFVGVSEDNKTLFYDYEYAYGDEAEELTMEQVREMYPLPDEKNDSINEGSVSGETEGRKFQNGDEVIYESTNDHYYKGTVIGYDGQYVIIKTNLDDTFTSYYQQFNESTLEKVGSLLSEVIYILEHRQDGSHEETAQEILKLFNKGEDK